jgi:hypothetical protein
MKRGRQYRGGYQCSGLKGVSRDLRKNELLLKLGCGSFFETASYADSNSDDNISSAITSPTFIVTRLAW